MDSKYAHIEKEFDVSTNNSLNLRERIISQWNRRRGIATHLRSQLDALSNEYENFAAKAGQECTTYQDALSDSTRRIHDLEQTLKDEAAKSGGMHREVNLKNSELTHLPEALEGVSLKRAHSTHQRSSPLRRTRAFAAPTPLVSPLKR